MEKNSIYLFGDSIIRVLEVKEDRLLVIDCVKLTMPRWITSESLDGYERDDPYKEGSAGYGSCKERLAGYKSCTEEELQELTGAAFPEMDSLDAECRKRIRERFTMIAGILPFVGVEAERSKAIALISEQWGVSKQTVRSYLCKYLAYRDVRVFAPHKRADKPGLTRDQKNMRWALNKYFYNYKKNSLMTAYTLLLKEKYCDGEGNLIPGYPSFYQFRYFYRKTKNIQNYLISRNGLKDYQRNSRPLTGGGIQEFAPNVGVGMLDATVCDSLLFFHIGHRPLIVVYYQYG
ncbi:MAG: hypothetical protein LUC95_04520 [Lachnospiraceae bacterium]|nr:hypothetical protein [Lachnospiraceae bacterium]